MVINGKQMCQWQRGPCARPATWLVGNSSYGTEGALCDGHKAELDATEIYPPEVGEWEQRVGTF